MNKPEDYKSWTADQVRGKLVELGMPKSAADALKPKSVAVKALIEKLGKSAQVAQEEEPPPFDELSVTAEIDEKELNLEVFGPLTDYEPVTDTDAVCAAKPEIALAYREPTLDVDPDAPEMTSPEWTNYVMKQFTEDELTNGNPTVDGLRRVAAKLLGPTIQCQSHIAATPDRQNFFCAAAVEFSLTIRWLRGGHDVRTFCGAADVCKDNTEYPFHRHPTATAETKAEGRALKRALMLRKVLAAEEVVVEATDSEELCRQWDPFAKITKEQKFALDLLCKQRNVSVLKLINAGQAKHESIDEVKYKTATDILEFLNELANGRKELPKGCGGYDPSWDKGDIS